MAPSGSTGDRPNSPIVSEQSSFQVCSRNIKPALHTPFHAGGVCSSLLLEHHRSNLDIMLLR